MNANFELAACLYAVHLGKPKSGMACSAAQVPSLEGYDQMYSYTLRPVCSFPSPFIRTVFGAHRPGVMEDIRNVPLPETGPLFGEEGSLLRRWSG